MKNRLKNRPLSFALSLTFLFCFTEAFGVPSEPPPSLEMNDEITSDGAIVAQILEILLKNDNVQNRDLNFLLITRIALGLPASETREWARYGLNRYISSDGFTREIIIRTSPPPLRDQDGKVIEYRNFPVVEFERTYTRLGYRRNRETLHESIVEPAFLRRMESVLKLALKRVRSLEQLSILVSEGNRGLFGLDLGQWGLIDLVPKSVLSIEPADLLAYLMREMTSADSGDLFAANVDNFRDPIKHLILKRDKSLTEVMPGIKAPLVGDWMVRGLMATGVSANEHFLERLIDLFAARPSALNIGSADQFSPSQFVEVDQVLDGGLLGWIRLAHYFIAWANDEMRPAIFSAKERAEQILMPVAHGFLSLYADVLKKPLLESLGKSYVLSDYSVSFRLDLVSMIKLIQEAQRQNLIDQEGPNSRSIKEITDFYSAYGDAKNKIKKLNCEKELRQRVRRGQNF